MNRELFKDNAKDYPALLERARLHRELELRALLRSGLLSFLQQVTVRFVRDQVRLAVPPAPFGRYRRKQEAGP